MKKYLLLVVFSMFFITTYTQVDFLNKIDAVFFENPANSSQEFIIYLHVQAEVNSAKYLKTKAEKGQFVFNQLQQTALHTQSNVLDLLSHRKVTYIPFYIVNCIWAVGDLDLMKELAELPEVAFIMENELMMMEQPLEVTMNTDSKNGENIEWGIERIKAPEVWELGYRGQGVVIGGQDTGYGWQIPGLKAKYRGWNGSTADHNYNWHDAIHEYNPIHSTQENPCGLDATAPCDDARHGTHTMGTMVADDSTSTFGVAPAAQWIGCRNMERGFGTPQTYLECFEWFLAPTDLNNENPDPHKAPHVINNSWSCPDFEGCNPNNFVLLETAVNNLKAAGVVVVVSAGNSGSDCNTINTPAAIFENSFTIGAIRENDTIANFSSRGTVTVDNSNRLKPNVAAPGADVRSYIATGDGSSFDYANFSGTSMAGPHVAGLVALLISADPSLAGQVETIETIIEQAAIPHYLDQDCNNINGSSTPNNAYGYGTIDALEAVMIALATTDRTIASREALVFPNPFSNSFTIEFEAFGGETSLELFHANGQLLYTESWEVLGIVRKSVEVPQLLNGVYFYRLCNGEDCISGKLVKF